MQGVVISPLAGREPERARAAAFAAALPAGARSLVIRGEAGIGKTALWRQAVADCARAGCRVLVSRPAEEELSLGLAGLVDLFEETGLDTDALLGEENALARGRAVLCAVRGLAQAGPVVLAVDDLQWLDLNSARALRFALRRLDAEPVGVLATLRGGPGAGDPLGAGGLLPPGRCEAVDLGPLDLEALRRVIGETPGAISRPALHRIHAISGGNPLYAIELARGMRDGDPRVPESLQAAIASRLAAVPGDLGALLEAVSALAPASVGELRGLFPGTELEVLLGRAEDAELLVVEEDLRVRFSHPLVGSVVYGRMRPLQRRRLHARLAAGSTGADVRARHLALSTDVPDAAVAAELEEAGERARRREAFELAADFAGHSLRVTPAEDEEAALRRALAEIQHRTVAGEVRRALSLADALVARTPPGPGRCEVLIARSSVEDEVVENSVAMLRRALADAGDDPALQARALDHLGWTMAVTGVDVAAGVAAVREAVGRIDPVAAPRDWMTVSADLAYLEALSGSPRPERMAQAVALEPRLGTHVQFTSPRTQQAELALWAGDLGTARALFTAVRRDAARSGTEVHHPYESFDLAIVACAAGDLVAAGGHVREGIQAARDAEDSYGERLLLYPLALLHAWRGRGGEARTAAGRQLHAAERKHDRPGMARARGVLGLVALSEGDCPAAARELAEAARLLHAIGFAHPGAFPVLPDAIEALAGAGRLREAETLLARLDRQAAAVDSAWARAAAARSRGALLLAGGDAAAARPPLEQAVAAFDRLGHRPDAARARFLLGRALLRAGRRNAAADALTGAREAFAAMGAPTWAARAARELERAAPGRTRGTLTPAERRIAGLVAEGMRNREICQALFMSLGTVEAHLTRIYRKLGIRSRSELARLVARGLE